MSTNLFPDVKAKDDALSQLTMFLAVSPLYLINSAISSTTVSPTLALQVWSHVQ